MSGLIKPTIAPTPTLMISDAKKLTLCLITKSSVQIRFYIIVILGTSEFVSLPGPELQETSFPSECRG